MPTDEQIEGTEKYFSKFYDSLLVDLFKKSVDFQKNNLVSSQVDKKSEESVKGAVSAIQSQLEKLEIQNAFLTSRVKQLEKQPALYKRVKKYGKSTHYLLGIPFYKRKGNKVKILGIPVWRKKNTDLFKR